MTVRFVDAGVTALLAASLRDRFLEEYGVPADVVSRSPGRINLIGEHTDYNGGRCLPLALPPRDVRRDQSPRR